MTRYPDPFRSRAVLIGASKFTASYELPPLPSIQGNLDGLRSALTDSKSGTIAEENCTVISDPTMPADIGAALARSAEATDVLFVYYSGHGLVDERGRLYLALSSTQTGRQLRWTGLPFDTLREEIASSPAAARILVLDCCFSGRAVEAMSDSQSVVAGQMDINGTYTITSTTATATSTAPANEEYTSFTGALLSALRGQVPLTLDDVYAQVWSQLSSLGLPHPQCRTTNTAGTLALTKGIPRGSAPLIGAIPGIKPGREFATRREAHDAKVHRPLQAGICGTRRNGAESIVISGGYKDDKDYGDIIIYTGHGGQDQSGNQVSDQSLDDPGNAALLTSHREGLPVRVIRGRQSGSEFSPKTGYRYDGLYRVSHYERKKGFDGFWICEFRLMAWEGTPTPPRRQPDS